MKKLTIVLILVLAIALLAPTPVMAKQVVLPPDVHRLRVDATIATDTYEDTSFEVKAVQIDATGNAIGRFTYTVTNTASGRSYVEKGIITAMRVVEGNIVVVGGVVLASTNPDIVGSAIFIGFENNPDEATHAMHRALSSQEDILNYVNALSGEYLFVVTTDLVPIDSGYVVLKPKT
jgi:hypothetical protein